MPLSVRVERNMKEIYFKNQTETGRIVTGVKTLIPIIKKKNSNREQGG